MASPAATKISPVALIAIGTVAILIAFAAGFYLSRSSVSPGQSRDAAVSAQAKAYVKQLQLSSVSMHASENFMRQQLIEVEGKITNRGDRPLKLVEVFCLFYSPSGQEIHRERSSVVSGQGSSLAPGQTRAFRLPFDALPDGWNQAVPAMVIASITFAD